MSVKSLNKKKSYLIKWNFNRYKFSDLEKEYNENNNTIDINWGNYLDDTKENRKKLEKQIININEDDEIFIYFSDIPGSSNQIYIKFSDFELKDKNNNNYIYKYSDPKDPNHGKIVKIIKPKKLEWILNYDNSLQFTRDGLNSYNPTVKERPPKQLIENEELIKELNSNLHTYKELITRMKKIDICFFTELYEKKANHDLFTKKQNMPYIEQHHFVLQEIYNNYIKTSNDIEKNEKLRKLIYSPTNLIILCPRCHRQMHQGLDEKISDMINILLNTKKDLLDNTKKIAELLNMSYIDLISNMYNINFKRDEQKKENHQ